MFNLQKLNLRPISRNKSNHKYQFYESQFINEEQTTKQQMTCWLPLKKADEVTKCHITRLRFNDASLSLRYLRNTYFSLTVKQIPM